MRPVDTERRLDGHKSLWHMDRIIAHEDKGERVAPVHIDMGLTKFCNIGCVFCYGLYQTPSREMIERKTLLDTMKEMGEAGVRSVALIGDGEPTCNPTFYDALYAGKKAGLSLATSTNGVLLNTPERRAAVLDNCEWMRFCISAGTKEGYKLIHQADKLDVVKRNIEAIVNERDKRGSKTDIGMQAVFVPTLMAEEMVEEAKLAVQLGVDYFVIKQCSLPDDGSTGMMMFDVNTYDDPRILDSLARAEAQSTDRTKIIPKWNVIAKKGVKDYDGCKGAVYISEISGNGDWFPGGCMFGNPKYDALRFGNLHKTSFKDILNSDRYWDIVKQMKSHDVHNSPACKGCCRLDPVNKFVDDYTKKPKGVNFI